MCAYITLIDQYMRTMNKITGKEKFSILHIITKLISILNFYSTKAQIQVATYIIYYILLFTY